MFEFDGDIKQACLGNFLSGMETSYDGGASAPPFCLGNFLSGMETINSCGYYEPLRFLGNFLSGMETGKNVESEMVFVSPWKLP